MNRLKARLGVTTCDKCGKTMQKGQKILILADGVAAKSTTEVDFEGSSVLYACHYECWSEDSSGRRRNDSEILADCR